MHRKSTRVRRVLVAAVFIISFCCYCHCLATAQSTRKATTCRLEANRSRSSSSSSFEIHRSRAPSDLAHAQHDRTDLTKRTSTRCAAEHCDVTHVDTALLPDFWDAHGAVDPRVATNGAEPPEQLVKVTDRRHRHPVFATVCSIAFLLTIITIIIVCTH